MAFRFRFLLFDLFGSFDHLGKRNAQALAYPPKGSVGRVSTTALEAADIGDMQAGCNRETLLGEVLALTQLSKSTT